MLNPHQMPEEEVLPESLRRLLDEYRRKLWRAKILEALLAGLIGLAVSFLVVFLLDRIISTSPIFRLLIFVSGSSLMAIFAPIWLRRWVWGHRKENELARFFLSYCFDYCF
jgi:predicted membrane protein